MSQYFEAHLAEAFLIPRVFVIMQLTVVFDKPTLSTDYVIVNWESLIMDSPLYGKGKSLSGTLAGVF